MVDSGTGAAWKLVRQRTLLAWQGAHARLDTADRDGTLQDLVDAVRDVPRLRPMHANRDDVVQPGVLRRPGFEHRQDSRVESSATGRVADPARRHRDLLHIVGAKHDADVKHARTVRATGHPIPAWTSDDTFEPRAFEGSADDGHDLAVADDVRRL